MIADYRLRTVPLTLPGARQRIGFLGWIAYECRSAATMAVSTLAALGRFASYAGMGDFVTQGMGAVRVSLTPEKGG